MRTTFFKLFALVNALTLFGGYVLYRAGVILADEPAPAAQFREEPKPAPVDEGHRREMIESSKKGEIKLAKPANVSGSAQAVSAETAAPPKHVVVEFSEEDLREIMSGSKSDRIDFTPPVKRTELLPGPKSSGFRERPAAPETKQMPPQPHEKAREIIGGSKSMVISPRPSPSTETATQEPAQRQTTPKKDRRTNRAIMSGSKDSILEWEKPARPIFQFSADSTWSAAE